MRDRLDRIETDLETIKEILLATARRAEAADARTAKTDERLSEQSQTMDERLVAFTKAADERGIKLDQRLDRLTQKQEESQRQIDALREDVDIAFQTISLMAENNRTEMAEFRAEMREMRLETRQIWEYLLRRSQNGGSPP